MSDKQLVARAERGAHFLDEKLGKGWRRKIRRTDLNMGFAHYVGKGSCGCVLAQIYGDYFEGSRTLQVTHDGPQARSLGFWAPGDYAALTRAWREVLRRPTSATSADADSKKAPNV